MSHSWLQKGCKVIDLIIILEKFVTVRVYSVSLLADSSGNSAARIFVPKRERIMNVALAGHLPRNDEDSRSYS
jgi:hypothetical protein